MNILTRTVFCLLVTLSIGMPCVRAQLVLNRQVTATTGGSGTAGTVRIQYTVGEPVITLITDGHLLLTQGFQQPDELPTISPAAPLVKGYIVFPNPAASVLKVRMDLLATANVQLELINTAGQTMYTTQQTLGPGQNTFEINVSRFAAAIYSLRIHVGQQIFYEKVIIQ
ncbi:T9SS type A sorting domain-containing protein [Chitinophaga sp. Cy-1792]|uniref:T9SS type A sorting domain-containing protein n=1 Tax=Chitinophaga sp. Cy-1792 TaxID=2608339 RepID=UPI00141DFEE4|nr:T9SS type A sorting domain-containing protein [Chitinophaga sp. Cy-1792]NIG56976.1 T9SS type A sorting domain-containing protein [Chitinophaga sp. Cy-1792]